MASRTTTDFHNSYLLTYPNTYLPRLLLGTPTVSIIIIHFRAEVRVQCCSSCVSIQKVARIQWFPSKNFSRQVLMSCRKMFFISYKRSKFFKCFNENVILGQPGPRPPVISPRRDTISTSELNAVSRIKQSKSFNTIRINVIPCAGEEETSQD